MVSDCGQWSALMVPYRADHRSQPEPWHDTATASHRISMTPARHSNPTTMTMTTMTTNTASRTRYSPTRPTLSFDDAPTSLRHKRTTATIIHHHHHPHHPPLPQSNKSYTNTPPPVRSTAAPTESTRAHSPPSAIVSPRCGPAVTSSTRTCWHWRKCCCITSTGRCLILRGWTLVWRRWMGSSSGRGGYAVTARMLWRRCWRYRRLWRRCFCPVRH